MNFSVIFGLITNQQQYIINASSWSNCLTYCEGTQQPISGIQLLSSAIINYNVEGVNCFLVTVKNSQGVQENHYVWETDFNSLSTWIEQQEFQSIINVVLSNKTYVVV